MNMLMSRVKGFWRNEEGLGTLELLLILAIIVVIAIAFRKWIVKWVGDLFTKANTDIDDITQFNSTTIAPAST